MSFPKETGLYSEGGKHVQIARKIDRAWSKRHERSLESFVDCLN